MKRTLLPLLAFVTLSLVGCGGSGGGDDEGPTTNQFAGTYDVTFSAPNSNQQQGTGVVTIDDEGDVNGTLQNAQLGQATLVGGIGNNGEFAGTATYGSGAAYVLVGTVQLTAGEQFSGTLTQSRQGIASQTVITAVRR